MKYTHTKFTAFCAAMLLAAACTACGGAENLSSIVDSAVTETKAETEAVSEETTAPSAETEAPTEAETMAETQPQTDAPTETEAPQPSETEPTDTGESGEFITLTVEDADKISIAYPQLDSGTAEAESINAIIRAHVDEMIEFCQEREDVARLDAIAFGDDERLERAVCSLSADNFEITWNDEQYLSICWTGYWSLGTAAHPNGFANGLIIDKETLSEVTLTDLYHVDEGFTQAVQDTIDAGMADALAQKLGTEPEEFAGMTSTVTTETLQTSNKGFEEGNTAYLTAEGMAISVYTYHAIGDHCEVIVPFETLNIFRK